MERKHNPRGFGEIKYKRKKLLKRKDNSFWALELSWAWCAGWVVLYLEFSA